MKDSHHMVIFHTKEPRIQTNPATSQQKKTNQPPSRQVVKPTTLLPTAISFHSLPLHFSAMHPIPSPPATVAVIFFLAVFLSVHLTTSFSVSADCNTTFSCGSLQNLSYPFTGGNHPEYCGPPEFRLSCSGRESAEITINSLKYRVLRVDQLQHTLTLARSDLWNETCPKKFVNTSLESRVFSYGVGNTNLTMLYRCNVSLYSLKPENRIWCVNFGIPSNDSYFLVGPIPYDPALRVIHCDTSISVPILESIAYNLTQNRSLLGDALMLGFNVNYTIPFSDLCSNCLGSGGQCEFDSNSSKPICICGDQVCSVSSRYLSFSVQLS